jgi:hypothetical protein
MKARADPPTRGSQWQLWPLNVKGDGKTGDTSEGEAGHHRMGISTICADIVGSTSIVDDRILNRRSLSVAKSWSKLAEWAGTLQKGAHIEVEGEPRYREYTPAELDRRIRVAEIHASSILALDRSDRQPVSTSESESINETLN